MFLEISQKLTGKHLCQSLFFKKVAGLRHATLLKKRLRHRCFSVNFAKFLRTQNLLATASVTTKVECFCHPRFKQSWRNLTKTGLYFTFSYKRVYEKLLKMFVWKYVRRMQKILYIWKPRHLSKKNSKNINLLVDFFQWILQFSATAIL